MSWEKWMFATDPHGDQVDAVTVAALLEHTADFKPKHRIAGGDHFDLRPLRAGAHDEDKREFLSADLAAGMQFIDAWRPTAALMGNHDDRLWRVAGEGSGVLSETCGQVLSKFTKHLESMRCRWFPYEVDNGVYNLHGLNFIHGFGKGTSEVAMRKCAIAFGPCLTGHWHTNTAVRADGKNLVSYPTAALCKIRMPFNKTLLGTLRHCNGWAYGVVNTKTGAHQVWQVTRAGNSFPVTTGLAII